MSNDSPQHEIKAGNIYKAYAMIVREEAGYDVYVTRVANNMVRYNNIHYDGTKWTNIDRTYNTFVGYIKSGHLEFIGETSELLKEAIKRLEWS